MGIVVHPTGKYELVYITDECDTQLDELQDVVNGSIEAVFLNDDLHGYVNEEGKIRGYWNNPVATAFVCQYVEYFANHDYIAGNMLIMEHDDYGNERGLTNHVQIMDELDACGGKFELPCSGSRCPACSERKIEAHEDCTDTHPVMHCSGCGAMWEVCD